jgi:hypothetical protein
MTNRSQAVELWARLEPMLYRCGLRDGRDLNEARPALIRCIGAALGETGEIEIPVRLDDSKPITSSRAVSERARIPRMPRAATLSNEALFDRHASEARLAAMLEKSCGRRVGYDGDDEVRYD